MYTSVRFRAAIQTAVIAKQIQIAKVTSNFGTAISRMSAIPRMNGAPLTLHAHCVMLYKCHSNQQLQLSRNPGREKK